MNLRQGYSTYCNLDTAPGYLGLDLDLDLSSREAGQGHARTTPGHTTGTPRPVVVTRYLVFLLSSHSTQVRGRQAGRRQGPRPSPFTQN